MVDVPRRDWCPLYSLRWSQLRRGHWIADSPLDNYVFVVWWVRIGKWHAFMIPRDYTTGSPSSEVRTLPSHGVRHRTVREAKGACLTEAKRISDILIARNTDRD